MSRALSIRGPYNAALGRISMTAWQTDALAAEADRNLARVEEIMRAFAR